MLGVGYKFDMKNARNKAGIRLFPAFLMNKPHRREKAL